MLNRINNLIGLTKNISAYGTLYVENGLVYTYHKDQILQAISDITADKKTIELGLEKGVFKITLDSYLEFEKNYKKEYSSFSREGNTLTLETTVPNLKYREEWKDKDTEYLEESKKFFESINQLTNDEERFIAEIEWTKDDISIFTKDHPVRLYINLDEGKIQFAKPEEETTSFLMVSLLANCTGKLNSSSKSVITRLFAMDDETTYLFNLEVVNGKCITNYYGLTMDSLSGEEVNSCQ